MRYCEPQPYAPAAWWVAARVDTDTETDDRGSNVCGWSEYGAWSDWSTECGTASRSRTRTCSVVGHCEGSDTDTETDDRGSNVRLERVRCVGQLVYGLRYGEPQPHAHLQREWSLRRVGHGHRDR